MSKLLIIATFAVMGEIAVGKMFTANTFIAEMK